MPPKHLQTVRQLPFTRIRGRIIAPVTPSHPCAMLTPTIRVHRWIWAKRNMVSHQWVCFTEQFHKSRGGTRQVELHCVARNPITNFTQSTSQVWPKALHREQQTMRVWSPSRWNFRNVNELGDESMVLWARNAARNTWVSSTRSQSTQSAFRSGAKL